MPPGTGGEEVPSKCQEKRLEITAGGETAQGDSGRRAGLSSERRQLALRCSQLTPSLGAKLIEKQRVSLVFLPFFLPPQKDPWLLGLFICFPSPSAST